MPRFIDRHEVRRLVDEEDADTSSVIVTTEEGQLIGVLGIDHAYDVLRGDLP